MSFRSIARDIRESFGSLSRRSFDVRLTGHYRGKSHGSSLELNDQPLVIQNSRWANLPSELLYDPGNRDGTIQCFIKRDKSNLTYHLFLCLSPALLVENGKFLLSAKRTRRTTCTEYVISMDADNISRSSSTYIGKLRSNFLSLLYDTQPPHTCSHVPPPGRTSRRFYSKKVSPKDALCYALNPTSSLEPGGVVPGQPELVPRSLEDSFRSISFSKSLDRSTEFSSSRFSDIIGLSNEDDNGDTKTRPLVLKNKAPRWHEQLQCWCLNFRGRVTVASVKNFQLIAANQPPAPNAPTSSQPTTSQPTTQSDHDKVILQFGKVGKDMFTMDYRYPLSAFQAFAICLSSFDTKLACE
ncbi:UNVERIFIED_CONTAM: Tubby-like F-box protein 8 [Sesamum radiatum]|uniref:Tubby-like F-box protein n=1 Tax=Sesamum radiatum TaxID=300843 RepID=A0AAW2U851_SESRA